MATVPPPSGDARGRTARRPHRDYLAELTMLILGRQRLTHPDRGYAERSCARWRTPSQYDRPGGDDRHQCGGLNPAASQPHCVSSPVASASRSTSLQWKRRRDRSCSGAGSWQPAHRQCLPGRMGHRRMRALRRRCRGHRAVTDASLVVGPQAARFGWQRDDWNALAGRASQDTSSNAVLNQRAATTVSSPSTMCAIRGFPSPRCVPTGRA